MEHIAPMFGASVTNKLWANLLRRDEASELPTPASLSERQRTGTAVVKNKTTQR